MSDFIYRLIGSPSLRLGQPGVELSLLHAVPAWMWALIVLACSVLAWLGYRRLEGPLPLRLGLTGLRAGLLLLLALLLCGPQLIKPNETEEKDWVLVLVDRSASLAIKDVAPQTDAGPRVSREDQLQAALRATEPVFRSLATDKVVLWLGFDGAAYDLPMKAGRPELSSPVGRRTDVPRAIDQALRRAAARPISGVVVLSDGRSIEEPSRQLLRQLDAEKIPVFTVPLGSIAGTVDLAVRRATAPRYAFIRDQVPVEVELVRTGPPLTTPEKSIVELVDLGTGATLETREITWDPINSATNAPESSGEPAEQSQRFTFVSKTTTAGEKKWEVRVRPAGAPAGNGGPLADMIEGNNRAELPIDLVDRPLRIAYFEGYPRWEYRYITSLLSREQSATSVIMLLAPGKRYIQEGTEKIDGPPRSREEWAKFDTIIMGDVWPGVFTNEQLTLLKERVAEGGAGLIWIGGEGATPGAWRGTPLADLLPMTLSESTLSLSPSGLDSLPGPLVFNATPAADRLGVLRLSTKDENGSYFPREIADPASGWSRLFYTQNIDPSTLKPTAEVLATATPVNDAGGIDTAQSRPALLSMRYGAGRVLYVATDETWRWRYARGEFLPERFWIQLIRLLGRDSVSRQGRPAILEATPERAAVEQPVRIQVTLLDQSLMESAPPNLRVRVQRQASSDAPIDSAQADEFSELSLPLESASADSAAGRRTASAKVYSTTWLPLASGRYRATAIDPLLVSIAGSDSPDLTARIEVWQTDDEMRRPQTDHAALTKLSESTGGKVLQVSELDQLQKLLPNRRLKLSGDPEVHTLWDTPLALLLLVLLLTAEWIGRRLLRLA